jgi:hypothetical protein
MFNERRSRTGRLLGDMMVLFRLFTVTTPVHPPDGSTILVTYWTNADAEQQWNKLKQLYDSMQTQKEG